LRLRALPKRRRSYAGIHSGDEEVRIKSKEEKIELEGEVIEAFRNGMYKIALENGQETLGYTAGKMRRYRIKILPGDRINIELSPYDLSRGRIVYRHR
jgi:translation initiation factor IF-1